MGEASDRWSHHIQDSRSVGRRMYLQRAINKYGADHFRVETLATYSDWPSLCEIERRAIVIFATRSPAGYNCTSGGDGARDFPTEIKELRTKGIAESWSDPLLRAQKSIEIKKEWQDPARRSSRVAAMKVAAQLRAGDPTFSGKMSEQTKRTWAESETYRERHSAGLKRRWADPAARARQSEAQIRRCADPDIREKRSASQTKRWADFELRARASAAAKLAWDRRRREAGDK